jgi:hypothetical protein
MHSASENKPFSWLQKKGFTFNQGPARNSFQKNSFAASANSKHLNLHFEK